MGRRGDAALVAALAVDAVGNGMFAPLSLLYFTTLTGLPLALVGVLVTVANLVALPLPVWAGALADRVGPRPVVVAAEVLMAAGFLGYAGVSGPAGVLLASAAVVCGIRAFWCSVFTLIADVAAAGRRTTDGWFAVANAARTAGLAVGSLITGVVAVGGSAASYRTVALVMAACLALAALLIGVFVRPPRRIVTGDAPSGYAVLLRDRPYLGLIAVNTVYALTSIMLALALPVVVANGAGPAWLTAMLLAANAVLIAVLSAPLVRRLAPFRRTRSVAAAAGLWTLWCLGLAVAAVAGPVVLVIGTLLFTVAEAVHAPISTALAEAAAPAAARARYLAMFQYSFAAASVIAPAFFAALYAAGHALPFLVLGALNAASLVVLLVLERTLPMPSIRPAPG